VAWCDYFSGEFLAAVASFERAVGELPADAAAEALWMAIVSLDALVELDPDNEPLADDLALLVARFLAEYPASEHAPKLVLRRAVTTKEVSPSVVDELLAIPPNSSVYEAARRRAAQVLYRLFRDAAGGQRIANGTRYIGIARPQHERDKENVDWSSPLEGERFIVRGRRLLEVSLYEGIARLVAARAVLESFDELREAGHDLSEIEPELAYRRVQERLMSDAVAEAEALADAIWADDPESPWARRAARAIFRLANRRWQDETTPRADARWARSRVVKYGSRMLARYADDPDALGDRNVLAWHAAVAGASFEIWEHTGDPELARAAIALYERLLEQRPRNARFLRATALLAARSGRPEQAIACWRTLVAGLSDNTQAWYEARFNLISLLAESDPERARAVLDQHLQLNPDYGPEPWRSRFRELDRRLGPAEPETTDPDPPGGGGDGGGDDGDPAGGGG
jgi:tetratricopeptide (TPR) repeat protein